MSNLRSESQIARERATASRDERLTSAPAAPLILSLDTATEVRSVAVVRGGRVLARTHGRVQRENTASVLQDIDETLKAAATELSGIDLFAVATGPGSFTGLRSGIATIKAFASTLNRPVAGVPTLHALAAACGHAPRVLASLPAGRGEVFAQLLSVDDAGAVEELSEAFHLSPARLLEKALHWGGEVKWAGGGAHAHAAALREFANEKGIGWRDDNVAAGDVGAPEHKICWTLAEPFESYAAQVATLGLINYRQGDARGAEDLHALYVRLSDAELNERCRV
ncbi:MAG TPA: tRNA (adenosine(37)-N6)-threonylcarbamoyltransferase complex dimerization subunit type 1 TsaB [Pyrinomonadaceae bacterium]|nr:tRNA (adenosine(37)-N6)-threonylcarbamoyltransferase complex dimerization subunit type 1 TsaB [Pyrinomonadaceae bacterium]